MDAAFPVQKGAETDCSPQSSNHVLLIGKRQPANRAFSDLMPEESEATTKINELSAILQIKRTGCALKRSLKTCLSSGVVNI